MRPNFDLGYDGLLFVIVSLLLGCALDLPSVYSGLCLLLWLLGVCRIDRRRLSMHGSRIRDYRNYLQYLQASGLGISS
jgi:hypothetical protein